MDKTKKAYSVGDVVRIVDSWKVSKRHDVASGPDGAAYSVYALTNGTTTTMLPEWLIRGLDGGAEEPETDTALEMTAKVEYTKGYNKGYYDAYEKIITQLICDNQINKQIIEITEQ